MRPTDDANGFRLEVRKGKKKEWFEGAEAERLAGQIIPAMNRMGGKKHTVQAAVGEIEHHGHPDEFPADVITGNRFADKKGVPVYINKMPAPTKLAPEIADISDNLLLPTETGDFIEKHRADGERSE